MKTLLFLLLSLSLSAQITTTPKVIYKAVKTDTLTVGFSPVGGNVILTVLKANEVIEKDINIASYHVLELIVDSGETVVASCIGSVAYTVYKGGKNVTPALTADNSFAEYWALYNSLTAAEQKRLNVYGLYKQRISLAELKKNRK